ncbi:RNA-directed DNA polymerase, eukaryota [Tanacetum coccineum]
MRPFSGRHPHVDVTPRQTATRYPRLPPASPVHLRFELIDEEPGIVDADKVILPGDEPETTLKAMLRVEVKILNMKRATYLASLITSWNGESLITGDFNEVRSIEERWGSVFNVQGTNAFNSFISSSGLIDIQLEGYSFTWAHPSATKMRFAPFGS